MPIDLPEPLPFRERHTTRASGCVVGLASLLCARLARKQSAGLTAHLSIGRQPL